MRTRACVVKACASASYPDCFRCTVSFSSTMHVTIADDAACTRGRPTGTTRSQNVVFQSAGGGSVLLLSTRVQSPCWVHCQRWALPRHLPTGLTWIVGCMAAAIASRGPTGPALAALVALGVILASWFPIQVRLKDTAGQPHGAEGVRKGTAPLEKAQAAWAEPYHPTTSFDVPPVE